MQQLEELKESGDTTGGVGNAVLKDARQDWANQYSTNSQPIWQKP